MFDKAKVILGKLNKIVQKSLRAASLAFGFAYRDPSAALLVARMAGWVAVLSVLIRLMPLPRILRLMRPKTRVRPSAQPSEVEARLAHLLDLLLATDFLFFTPTCWKRAPVLYRFLALEGIETRILFGVRKDTGGALDGHAWLEARGRPLLEASAPDYTVTYAFPA
ncbi:MAG TPA: lasso peptide biosynthesis B2 protein [Pyrinomonadaceae bacterium]|nr:lasso peptide biosynthesis B2 protein [Pyrinomonadaceae bacterium]